MKTDKHNPEEISVESEAFIPRADFDALDKAYTELADKLKKEKDYSTKLEKQIEYLQASVQCNRETIAGLRGQIDAYLQILRIRQ